MAFRVELDIYQGPLDLLLHLVRNEELEIAELPLARITGQYLEYVAVLEQIDIDSIGDFLDVASTLIELKSRLVLPRTEEVEEEIEDAREQLVERLLEYKKYRDAAALLADRGREWRQRYSRQANDLPSRRTDPADQPIHGVELWDLVSAFGRVMREKVKPEAPTNIRYDDTPVQVYMLAIHRRLVAEQNVAFSELFPEQVHKSTLVGMFLAVLELVRRGYALTNQSNTFGDILMAPGPNPLPSELSGVDDYASHAKEPAE